MPAIPPQMIVPLDVGAIAVTLLLGVVLLILWDWKAAVSALIGGSGKLAAFAPAGHIV